MHQSKTKLTAWRWMVLPLLLALSSHSPAQSHEGKKNSRKDQASPEQHEKLEKHRKHFESLSPEEQKRAKAMRKHFKDLPPEKRRELKEKWQKMTPEQRNNFRKSREQRSTKA